MKTSTLPNDPWNTRLNAKKLFKRVKLDKDFAGIKAGSLLFVGTPQIIDAYVRKVPAGETRTIERLRRELARQHDCDATCPVSTAIFLRISAQAAIEQMNAGKSANEVAPFWRVIEPNSTLASKLAANTASKLTVDSAWIAQQRAQEMSP
jgi:hypothetical protein